MSVGSGFDVHIFDALYFAQSEPAFAIILFGF